MPNRNRSYPKQRCHIVLVPGFGGFDALGRVNYYAGITRLFQDWMQSHRQADAVLHYFDNLPTAAVVTRAERLRKYLAKRMARGEMRDDENIILVGHSTGGLDIRQLIWDLGKLGTREVLVDGGSPIRADRIRRCIRAAVFLSVPHWGTNIADWVYQRAPLRTTIVADLRAAFAGSQVCLLDRLEAGFASGAAELTNANVLLALRDALTEANDDGSNNASRIADAEEAASELQLYFRQMATDFHVIDDLTPEPHPNEPSPAHFGLRQREEELEYWEKPRHIRTLSYATVGGRAFQFRSGSPAPRFNLTNPFDELEVLRACGTSRDTDISYRLCYRACAGGPLTPPQGAGEISRVLGPRPPEPLELWDNDGIVNTVSMLWPLGENVLVQADHLDIVGHFELTPVPNGRHARGNGLPRQYESYDTLRSAPKFKATTFAAVWNEIFCFAAMPDIYRPLRTGAHKAVAVAGK